MSRSPLTVEALENLKATLSQLRENDSECDEEEDFSDDPEFSSDDAAQMELEAGYVSPKRVSRKRPSSPSADIPTANKYAVLDPNVPDSKNQPGPSKATTAPETDKKTPKPTKVPPITIKSKEQWVKISTQLALRKINYIKAKNTPQGIKIDPTTAEDYRAATKWLNGEKSNFSPSPFLKRSPSV